MKIKYFVYPLVMGFLLIGLYANANSKQERVEVRNPMWCFDFIIAGTTASGNACERTERLCNLRRQTVLRESQGNLPCGECRQR